MKKIIVLTLFLLVASFVNMAPVSAQSGEQPTLGGNLKGVAEGIGYKSIEETNQPFTLVITRALRAFFSMLALIFLGIVLYAGFRWMTAGGKQEQVDEAKKWLINACIGLAICVMSYAITVYIGTIVAEVGTPHYQYYPGDQ